MFRLQCLPDRASPVAWRQPQSIISEPSLNQGNQSTDLRRSARNSKGSVVEAITAAFSYCALVRVLCVQPRLKLAATLGQKPGKLAELEFGEVKNFVVIKFVEEKKRQCSPLRIRRAGNPHGELCGLELFNLCSDLGSHIMLIHRE